MGMNSEIFIQKSFFFISNFYHKFLFSICLGRIESARLNVTFYEHGLISIKNENVP